MAHALFPQFFFFLLLSFFFLRSTRNGKVRTITKTKRKEKERKHIFNAGLAAAFSGMPTVRRNFFSRQTMRLHCLPTKKSTFSLRGQHFSNTPAELACRPNKFPLRSHAVDFMVPRSTLAGIAAAIFYKTVVTLYNVVFVSKQPLRSAYVSSIVWEQYVTDQTLNSRRI